MVGRKKWVSSLFSRTSATVDWQDRRRPNHVVGLQDEPAPAPSI